MRAKRIENGRLVAPTFEQRKCDECGAEFTPTGPAGKYCPEHQDARLRAQGKWSRLRERSRRRGVTSDRCECCGGKAEGASYHGVVCCAQCRADADHAAKEWLEDRREREMREARAS